MNTYSLTIALYIVALLILNFFRMRRVKNQDDMMVAGRSLSVTVMIFTLICTWIGSGTFIGGAEFAAKAGWSAMWQPLGAWLGILVIYFLAAKIRTFGQYTIGDILEVRYGSLARLVGAAAIIISFTTIVSYQFRAGGFILNAITGGKISVELGQFLAALFVVIFTATAGMIAVAYTDLPNGIIILLSTIIATPIVMAAAGWSHIKAVLPAAHFQTFNQAFGANPYLKIPAYTLSVFLLLLGVQSMYQKFYSARTARDAKKAVALWLIGTIIVEAVVIVLAIYATSYFKERNIVIDPASTVIQAAKLILPVPVGVLLLGAATAVVLSTGMNYLLSPTTNIMRDIYQRFINPQASQHTMVLLQKSFVIIIGICAYLLVTQMKSVLETAFFAYTVYGAAITPALIAALAWKRANKAGGLASILSGGIVAVALKAAGSIWPSIMRPLGDPNADPFGIPIIYPAFAVSLLSLVLVSYLTKPPAPETLVKLFPEKSS